MTKSERREALLAIGTVTLILGVAAIFEGAMKPLMLETIGLKITELVGGAFISIIGAYLCAWGVSDEAGKNASKFLRALFNRFLKALDR